MSKKKAQQRGHGGEGGGLIVAAVIHIMARAAAEGNGSAAAEPPQKPAHKAENMAEGQHTEQNIRRVQRQLLRAVPCRAHETLPGQHNRFGTGGGAGGEKQNSVGIDPAGADSEEGRELFAQLLVTPETVYIRVRDAALECGGRGEGIQHNHLKPGDVCRQNGDDTIKTPVRQNADAALAG